MPADRVAQILRGAGVAAREIRTVDLPQLRKLPDTPAGFGITGPTGTGKTVLLVQHLAAKVQAIVDASHDPAVATVPHNFAQWVNWPDGAEHVKSLSGAANRQDLELLLERLATCGSLYLDDLGQERIKGEDDFSLGHLRVILDARYRADRPVFWTSNLGYKVLCEAYGSRTVSRMVQAWPPVKLSGRDLRIPRGGAA